MKKTYHTTKCLIMSLCLSGFGLIAAPLNGVYTLNSGAPTSATNYTSFTALATALNTDGVSGPVTINVVLGQAAFNEQITFNQIVGASSINRITINGNGNMITFNSTNSAQPWTIAMNGADYFSFNNLIIQGTGPTYAFATALSNNADFNFYTGCTFSVSISGTGTGQIPFMISGNLTAYSSSGFGANYTTIQTCTTIGGYNGVSIYGNGNTINNTSSATTFLQANQVIGCTILDFYYAGIWNYAYTNGTVMRNNLIRCPNRTNTTTKSGIYCYLTDGAIIEGNWIKDLFNAGLFSNTSTCYGIYAQYANDSYNYGFSYPTRYPCIVRNNIISDINHNGPITGIYFYYADGDVYNNTVSLDYQTSTSGSTTYGIYSYASTNPIRSVVKNNIVSVTRGGSATKYGIYNVCGCVGAYSEIDRNCIWMNAPAGTNYVGYGTTNALTQTVFSSQGFNGTGMNANPMFTNIGLGDYHPTNPVINNLAIPMGLVFDQQIGVRNPTTPDIGALEFLTPACTSTAPLSAASGPTYALCPGEKANLSVSPLNPDGGITYQWQNSTISNVGPWTNLPGANTVLYTTPSMTSSGYYNLVMTCTNPGGFVVNSAVQVSIATTQTNSVPYLETFESLPYNNRLPNCSWSASSLGSGCLTYTSSSSGFRLPYTGNSFAAFNAATSGSKSFYTNGIWMNAGVTYSANLWYLTEMLNGYATWTELSILVGQNQNPSGLQMVATTGNAAIAMNYKQLQNTFTVATSGIYYVAIRATSSGVQAPYLSWDDLSITIPCTGNLNPVPVAVNAAGNTTVCSGDQVVLNAGGADTYLWSTGATGPSITEFPIVASTPSVFAYSVYGTSQLSGCTSTATQMILVNPTPVITLNGPSSTCSGKPISLTATGANNISWSTGATGPIVTIAPVNNLVLSVSGTGANGCPGSITQQITVYPLPNIGATSASQQICIGEGVFLTASGPAGATYQWTSPSIFLVSNPIYVTPNMSTTYSVTGTNSNGCSKTAQVTVDVDACTGLRNAQLNNQISIYPSPTSGEFVIETGATITKAISVMDVTGRVVRSGSTSDAAVTMNISELSNGIYYVRIQSENQVEILKVVKQ